MKLKQQHEKKVKRDPNYWAKVLAGMDQKLTAAAMEKSRKDAAAAKAYREITDKLAEGRRKRKAERAWIEAGQLNPLFDKTKVLAIEGDKETVVYPELVREGDHAVIDRIMSEAV
jgi:hypothetical protein